MKIGVFGGCFNPPHVMHKNIVVQLLEKGVVDKIIVVPTGDKYKKDGLLCAEHRKNMLDIMFKGISNVSISTFEIERGAVQTFDTLNYFADVNKNDEIMFICGGDNLRTIDTWNNWEKLLEKFKIIVVKRDTDIFEMDLNSSIYKKATIIVADIKENRVSSTEIRAHIEDDVYLLGNNLVNKSVLEYIEKNKLYYN